MHLTYDIEEKDLHRGTRQKIISNALSTFGIEDQEGELVLEVPEERYGDALYSFVQGLLKITDVSFLSRERVRSTFMEDFRALLSEVTPEERRSFDWTELREYARVNLLFFGIKQKNNRCATGYVPGEPPAA